MFWLLLLIFIIIILPAITFFVAGRSFTKKLRKIFSEREVIEKEQTPQMRTEEVKDKKIKKIKKAIDEYVEETDRNPILWFLFRPIEKIINKFPKESLRKDDILLVKPNNGYWICPSCHDRNKELQDICSTCGQEIEKINE